MYDVQKLELRVRQLEAKAEAQAELLLMIGKTITATSPAASELLSELRAAATYGGPSSAKKELAALAQAVAGASSGS